MSLARLIERFANVSEPPVEVPEIRDAILQLGFQDDITFVPESIDPGTLRGVFYQYTKRVPVYGDPQLCTLIIYSNLLPIAWQRLVCAKELIHVMDARVEQTKTADEVTDLIVKVLGPLSTDDFGLADFVALKDKLALYQALPILFPDAARSAADKKLQTGEKTIEEIAEWACVPLPLVRFIMSDDWPSFQKDICSF